MAKLGPDKTRAAIEYTIRQGYKGLIEPNAKNGQAPRRISSVAIREDN